MLTDFSSHTTCFLYRPNFFFLLTINLRKKRRETFEKCICVFFTVEAKNNECSSSSMRWSRRNDEMCFEQAYTHVRQFVNKNGLHKTVFFSFFFLLLSCIYIYIYTCSMYCASFTLTSRPQNVN